MITPEPIPLTLGRWLSSLENGHRLVEAAFFSLEMFTTLGIARATASVSGFRREARSAIAGPEPATITVAASTIPSRSPLRRIMGNGTMEPPWPIPDRRPGEVHRTPRSAWGRRALPIRRKSP